MIDPTAIGAVIGLAKMGEIKTQLAEESEADRLMELEEQEQSNMPAKMDKDFNGAVALRGDRMDRWSFVHNEDDGPPADATQKPVDLGAANPAVKLDQAGYPELFAVVVALSVPQLEETFSGRCRHSARWPTRPRGPASRRDTDPYAEPGRQPASIVFNRRAHLSAEIAAAGGRSFARVTGRNNPDRRRARLMGILHSGGALEHYEKLHNEAGRAEANAEGLRQRLEIAERIESTRVQREIARARLRQALPNDLHEHIAIVNEAIALKSCREPIMNKLGT